MSRPFVICSLFVIFLCGHTNLCAGMVHPFPQPTELEPDIRFWTRVFTKVDTHHGLIHDSWHLDVVYEVIALPKGGSKRAHNRLIKRVKERYRKILLELAKGNRKRLNAKQKQVLKLWPQSVSNKTLKAAASRLRFQLGQADKFQAGWIRSGAWQQYIKTQLKKQGLPEGLAALPHVESSFNPDAYSRVGAAGIWQFTRSTGRRFMRIDHIVDERMDPFKSSEAAARLLKYNYTLLGSWPLAITAYNHGAAGMRQAVQKLGTKNIVTILRRYKSRTFGFASRNFYVAFIAAMKADRNAGKYFGALKRSPAQKTELVQMPAYITLADVHRALDIDLATLKQHNLGLRPSVWNGDKRIPKGYDLRVACRRNCGSAAAALRKIDVADWFDRQIPDRLYKVRRGDSLSRIASRYRISTKELAELNMLRSRHHIRLGQVLRLPPHDSLQPARIAAASTPIPASKSASNEHYRVKVGDTIGKIARRYGLDEDKLVEANNIRNKHTIHPGQTLRLALRTKAPTYTANGFPKSIEVEHQDPGNRLETADQNKTEASVATLSASTASDDTEPLGPTLPAELHPDLSADPSNYTVARDGTIEVQAVETLGHFADWLQLPTQTLRDINKLPFGKPLLIGKRLKLDFSKVTAKIFEQQRTDYHREIQEEFFNRYQISDTRTHVVKRGESLWALTHRKYNMPIWLLRQYNPDLNPYDVRPGMKLRIPKLARRRDVT